MSSDALTTCPVEECQLEDPALKGTGEVSRMVSGGAGLVFKGDGFYLTDYVRKGGSEGSASKSGSNAGSSASSSSSSQSDSAGSSTAGGGDAGKSSTSSSGTASAS